jgi:hypothetical protein
MPVTTRSIFPDLQYANRNGQQAGPSEGELSCSFALLARSFRMLQLSAIQSFPLSNSSAAPLRPSLGLK